MNRLYRTFLPLAALLLLAMPAEAATSVTLKHNVQIDRPAIRLGDVFDGLPKDRDRDIAVAPAPGKSVTYDFRVLTKLAEDHRLSWQPQSTGEKTVLTRASTQITASMIEAAVKSKIKEGAAGADDQLEIMFDNRNIDVALPANREPVFELVNFSYDAAQHRFRAELVAQTGGSPINQPVAGRVVIKKNVPVLTQRLPAGTTIGKSDLSWIAINEEHLGIDVITSVDALIGQELRHDHTEGELLRQRDVIAPRLVTRGSLVTMRIETPAMLITTQGRALQDGAKGDVVRVTNIQSNRIVEGTVEATGVVRVGPFLKVASTQ
jgi:flagella basal body P-ring formation protein FlgA